LRHDPDVILVGETRSLDTADTIVNAALTGHLVLTTVHTNSALETISRLTSMGVKTFLLAPAIQLICAQRLVRKLCPHCLVIDAASSNEKKEMYMYLEHVDTDELDLGTDGRN
jgi:type II secretory ATPase GspE/PulE/Tfp pilus assembly ATPase PilB-like protein